MISHISNDCWVDVASGYPNRQHSSGKWLGGGGEQEVNRVSTLKEETGQEADKAGQCGKYSHREDTLRRHKRSHNPICKRAKREKASGGCDI